LISQHFFWFFQSRQGVENNNQYQLAKKGENIQHYCFKNKSESYKIQIYKNTTSHFGRKLGGLNHLLKIYGEAFSFLSMQVGIISILTPIGE
jgi:hypothetical protein